MLLSQLSKVFNALPAQQMLAMARDIQSRLITDASLVLLKDKKDYVTKADYDIQRLVLDYFAQSPLAGTYRINSEEVIADDQQVQIVEPTWQLLIDPLDGTTAFCEQQDIWGVMVGGCDLSGKLMYSWNLVSTGEIYTTDSAQQNMIDSTNTILERVDVYDYGVKDSQQRFAQQTSYPAAVWTGWKLYTGELDGLVWLPSTAGKKTYPEYDLIFLGALEKQGWQVHWGVTNGKIHTVAVARNKKNLQTLINISLWTLYHSIN